MNSELLLVLYSDGRGLNDQDHLISPHGKKFGNQMPFGYRDFYHSNRELLVHYSRHGLNNGPFDAQTVLNHLKTKLVRHSDPNCIWLTATYNIRLPDLKAWVRFLPEFVPQTSWNGFFGEFASEPSCSGIESVKRKTASILN